MTDDKITLQGLLEKSSDASFLREMIGFAAQRLMELEVDTLCGAAHGERSSDRVNQRTRTAGAIWRSAPCTMSAPTPNVVCCSLIFCSPINAAS